MQYIIAGLVLGGIFGLAAAGLVITYASAGIMNFAFGAEAYFIARMYYYLHTQEGWGIAPAAVICILVVGPAMGVVLYLLLFRSLRFATTLIKVVATVGLSVALPALAVLCFGNPEIVGVPGLAPVPVKVFKVLGTAITLDQVIILICVVVISAAGWLILRFTDVGLAMRAMVDSPALTALSGTSRGRVSVGVWIATTFLAGLAGVLVAPTVGLTSSENFTLLISSAFAAVIAAKLRHLGRAVLVAFLLGILGGFIQWLVPADSVWSADSVTAIPFVVTALFVLYYAGRGQARESGPAGGFLDRAIAFEGSTRRCGHGRDPALALSAGTVATQGEPTWPSRLLPFLRVGDGGPIAVMVIITLLPWLVGGIWVGFVGLGLAYGVVLLSYTIVTGEGGMISLCQITFAGVGGVATAQLASNHGWPVLASILAGGVIAVPIGVVIGLMSIVLGDLYFALVTLTFGILMDNLVFTLNVFSNYQSGVVVGRPDFASGDRAFTYLALVTFCIFAAIVVNIRRSTTGLAIAAIRWSESASRTLGVNVLETKILLTAFATFIAGVGGGLLVIYDNNASPANFATLGGLVWLAVLVTVGIRSNVAAAVAGLSFAIIPAVFVNYLPVSVAQVPTALFGLGAILVVRNPDGTVVIHGQQLQRLLEQLLIRREAKPEASPGSERASSVAALEISQTEPSAGAAPGVVQS
jgi:branched-chain amino acid transport system permease protein